MVRQLTYGAARHPPACAVMLAYDLENGFDFDGDLHRQASHSNCGTRMTARFAENLDQQIGAAVDDARMIGELRYGVDHSEQLDDAFDAIERTERYADDCKEREPDEARIAVRFL